MGKVIMSGIVPQLTKPVVPVNGILAGNLAVGSSVYLLENGTAVEYLVVHQGIPSNSSIYDSTCNGTWLLRKDLHSDLYEFNDAYSSKGDNCYYASTVNKYLKNTILPLFDTATQAAINTVNIPHVRYAGTSYSVKTGSNGLSTKLFLLSAKELAFDDGEGENQSNGVGYQDGAALDYFAGGYTDLRIAKRSGEAHVWWTRSAEYGASGYVISVTSSGGANGIRATYERGIRPALVMNPNAVFDEETLLFKEVA